MKRLICLICMLTLAFCLFAGCVSKETEGSHNNESAQAQDVISRDDIVLLNDDKESVYRVVRPDGDAGGSIFRWITPTQMRNGIIFPTEALC